MRKVLVLTLGLALGGCAQLTAIENGISLASKTAANPVTKDDLYKVESSVQIIFTALKTYKASCVKGLVDARCKQNIAAIQQYTVQLPPYLAQLRSFVRTNDQVNAAVVYNQLTTLYANARQTAVALGVNLGG